MAAASGPTPTLPPRPATSPGVSSRLGVLSTSTYNGSSLALPVRVFKQVFIQATALVCVRKNLRTRTRAWQVVIPLPRVSPIMCIYYLPADRCQARPQPSATYARVLVRRRLVKSTKCPVILRHQGSRKASQGLERDSGRSSRHPLAP